MPNPKVFITRKIADSGIKLLKQSCEVKIYPKDQVIPKKELLKGVKWCDALLCLLTDTIDKDIIKANPKLKVISNYAVGFNNIDIKCATEKRIPVCNTPGVLTDAVAEHTFALMLAITKRITEGDTFMKKRKFKGWEPLLLLGTELKGKTLGIIGLGRIGIGVAQRAGKGMGMNIIYYDVKKNKDFEKEYNAKYESIENVMQKADIITLHVPLLPETQHLINRKRLSMLKKSAYLINTSRGAVVDEKALVSALQKKQITGAALDVYEHEPKLTAGLTELDNVILTPHTASATREARSAMSELAAKNIIAILQGKKPEAIVNPEVLKTS